MMAAGGLVILRENEGNVEYAKDRYNCLMYNGVDHAAELFTELVNDKELRIKLTDGGKRTAQKRDWKNIQEDILEFWAKRFE